MSYTPAATALATANPQTVHAVADSIDLDLVTAHVDGRTTYTARVMEVEVHQFDGDRRRFEMALEVTRNTSRSIKTFQVHLSVDNYASYAGEVDSLRVNTVYNENGNQVRSDRFDGYRQAAMAHAVQVTTAALEALDPVQETTAVDDTAVEAAQDDQDQPETAPAAAVEDTAITTHLDPDTGGRVLDDKDRQALRQGPPLDQATQDDTEPALSTALDQTGPMEAASVRRTVFYLSAAYRNDPGYSQDEVLEDLRRRTGWSAVEAAQVLDSELGETYTQSGEVVHAPTHAEDTADAPLYEPAHAPGYITAEHMATLQLYLADPDQPELPGLPEPRHQVLILLEPLDCEPDPLDPQGAGAWWRVERPSTTVRASLEVQDGDTEDRVERAAMEAVTRLFPTVEWFDMSQLENQWNTDPDMGDREAAVFTALDDGPLAYDDRRWVGLSGIDYRQAEEEDW